MPIEGTAQQITAELTTATAAVAAIEAEKAKTAGVPLPDPTNPTPSILVPHLNTGIDIVPEAGRATAMIETLKGMAPLSDQVLAELANNRPITPAERKFAEQFKERIFKDREWQKRYWDGEAKATKEMLLLNILLSSDVREA